VNSQYAVNDQIRTREVRLIADSGEQVGVISTTDARNRARDAGLDLVAINISDGIPICKILDYGKFKYEQSRKEKEAAARAREARVEIKEIQLRPTTDSNDLKVKARRAQGFLEDGDKVKVIMKFKGREITHMNVGAQVMHDFFSNIQDFKYERPIARSERQLFAIIAPAAKKPAQA
jgi:translation initiation factor IF-3